jgi:hypothetical protein
MADRTLLAVHRKKQIVLPGPGPAVRSYFSQMRCAVVSLIGLMFVGLGCGGSGRVVSSHGVRVSVPKGWARVRPANDAPVTDPRTLLVVGTPGVRPKSSQCEVAAYRIPDSGAVVVVVGWRSVATAGSGARKPGRAPLEKLLAVAKPSAECFGGRGAAADVLLDGKPYQVSVLVGDGATKHRVAQALAVARSFDRSH